MNDFPPGLLVAAQTRIAANEGIPMVVVRRGHETSGTIILRVNRLDGTSHVYAQTRLDDEVVWNPVSRHDPMPDSDAERYLDRQANIDPDSWLVEIEDKAGRHWFPGRICKF